MYIPQTQPNLIDSKSSGLEVLFRIVSSSNYSVINYINYITPIMVIIKGITVLKGVRA